MIEIRKFMTMDGKEFFTSAEALIYETDIIPHYCTHIKFKCVLPCESFTVGAEYPFIFKYVGISKVGLIITVNDNGKETSLGETWVDGIIKTRFEVIHMEG